MGKFDLDDLLKDFTPAEPGSLDDALSSEPLPADDVDLDPGSSPPPPFVRNDPRETPRPPDPSGDGLGGETDFNRASENADPARIKPNDALAPILSPSASGHELADPDDIGRRLVDSGIITSEQVATALRVIRQTPGKRLAWALIEMGVSEAAVQHVVAESSRLPFENFDPEDESAYDLKAVLRLTPDYCKSKLVLPLRREGSRLVVGTVNPEDVFLLDDVKRRLGVASVKHVLVTAQAIRSVVEILTESDSSDNDFDVTDLLADVDEDDVSVVEDSIDEADVSDAESSPVVRYVNHIIQTALREGASDIHIEPEEKALNVRFRIDGVLFEMMTPPRKMHAALTSRVKIMANLDIAERRLPQDGRIRVTVLGRKLDLRVSTVPTPKGEKTVMRILDNRSISVTLDELGFAEDTLMIWKNQIAQPHGIILVTGPTGSGKTTTLYSSLQQLDLRKLNVSTVEDPVEYNLQAITQIQTHDRIGMSFAAALRALMRQDPDVIMVGEIRDLETATIAIQAAMTGHLVLSTLHTNDAPASITRLINIGIEPFLVGAAVSSVLAQRLVRRICANCHEPIPVNEETQEFLTLHGVDAETLNEGKGCPKCRETGYAGRVGLYELLILDDHLRDAVAGNPNVTEFRRQCTSRGMVTLREDGFLKVGNGQTTVEEVLRVTEATI